MKALSRGIQGQVWFTQVEVENDALNAPHLELSSEAARLLKAAGANRIHVSITHTRAAATAVVILEA